MPVAQPGHLAPRVDGGIAVLRTGGTGTSSIDLVGYVASVPLPTVAAPYTTLLGHGDPGGA